MLIVSRGDEYIQTQMIRQLAKLYDVREVVLLARVAGLMNSRAMSVEC